MLSLTYEYKAVPTREQVQMIEHTLTVCRKVWNFALRERKDWINSRKCQINACSITSEYIMPTDAPRPTYGDTRKDWHFKLAHKLCDGAGMIFVEDIDFQVWARGLFGKHTLDAGFGQFLSILKFVCSKRGVYYALVDKNYTSQVCPECDAHTGKKDLSVRIHTCPECGYRTHRDVAAAQIVRNRGLSGVGRILDVKENACEDGLTGTGNSLVKSRGIRKKGGERALLHRLVTTF